MLNEHDEDLNLRCCRLGHEINFGYCRQESRQKPCRLILDCWWERFDVRAFLRAHLSQEQMCEIERASSAPPASKVFSLLDTLQETKERLARESEQSERSPKR
jgi:hypothetical protein